MRAFELKNAALAIVAEVWNNFPQYRQSLSGLQVRTNQRLTVTAGRANSLQGYVELSTQIFGLPENERGVRNTVLHELAHIIADRMNNRRVRHAGAWRRIFLQLGGNGKRTHDYTTPKRTTQRRRAIRLVCCGAEIEVGPRRYAAWASRKTDYRHTSRSHCKRG